MLRALTLALPQRRGDKKSYLQIVGELRLRLSCTVCFHSGISLTSSIQQSIGRYYDCNYRAPDVCGGALVLDRGSRRRFGLSGGDGVIQYAAGIDEADGAHA